MRKRVSSKIHAWRIEYTDHPPVKKRRKKVLEKAIANFIDKIRFLLETKADNGFMLGDTDFCIESTWLKDLQKHHVAVRDLKSGDSWVASIIFENYPTMNVHEVKASLRKLGFNEYSLYALGVTNEKTVGELLAELEANFSRRDREEWLREMDFINLKFLNEFLKRGIIKPTDGLLDAFRKIDRLLES